MSATGCRWLRQHIFSNLPDVESKQLSFSSKIYISRPKTVGRYLINEDEVLEALTPFGFVAYTPGKSQLIGPGKTIFTSRNLFPLMVLV